MRDGIVDLFFAQSGSENAPREATPEAEPVVERVLFHDISEYHGAGDGEEELKYALVAVFGV